MAVRGHVHEMERQMKHNVLSKQSQQKLATHKNQGWLQGLAKMAAYEKVNHDDDTQQDERYDDELQFICVKFSSLSGVPEIINDMSGDLLNKIQALAAAKNSEPDKSKKRAAQAADDQERVPLRAELPGGGTAVRGAQRRRVHVQSHRRLRCPPSSHPSDK